MNNITEVHMHRLGAQEHGLGANEPTCTPLATPLVLYRTKFNDCICSSGEKGNGAVGVLTTVLLQW